MDNYLQGLQQRPMQPVPQQQPMQPVPQQQPMQPVPQQQPMQPVPQQQPTIGPTGIWRELARIIMGGDDGA